MERCAATLDSAAAAKQPEHSIAPPPPVAVHARQHRPQPVQRVHRGGHRGGRRTPVLRRRNIGRAYRNITKATSRKSFVKVTLLTTITTPLYPS